MKEQEIYESLISIVTFFNNPTHDGELLNEAGVSIERAAFPPFVGIARLAPVTMNELSETMDRDRSAVSRNVDKLIREELVIKEKDPDDARKNVLILTEKGTEIANKINQTRMKKIKRMLSHFNDNEVENVNSVLKKISGILNKV